MIKLRKLAAIDIFFLGPAFIIAEYAVGVFFSAALGLIVMFRGHSFWQLALGLYFLCLGINYVPLFVYALSIGNKERAQSELSSELGDKRSAMAKYRRQSLLLLLPLVVPLLALSHGSRNRSPEP